ncbi:MAG: hypothetical protein AB2729_02615, partial [Candidatus Thiodiazotropha taylori]
ERVLSVPPWGLKPISSSIGRRKNRFSAANEHQSPRSNANFYLKQNICALFAVIGVHLRPLIKSLKHERLDPAAAQSSGFLKVIRLRTGDEQGVSSSAD